MTNPRVTDDDSGEITVALDGRELRGWSYKDDAERRVKMGHAREYTVEIADKVVSLAQDALRSVDLTMTRWPPEFRAIVWDAIADIASRRAAAARIGKSADV